MLSFTWDRRKDLMNTRKHGVSFEEAASVFLDEHARFIEDPDHHEEERFILMGMSTEGRILLVCHCERHNDVIRIISARKASPQERNSYEEHRHA